MDDGQNINSACSIKVKHCSTQTEQIKSLPCSKCIENEVSLHPAVSGGHVDIVFAGAFIDKVAGTSKQLKKRKLHRDTSKGRCLTHKSELNRLENMEQEKKKKGRSYCETKECCRTTQEGKRRSGETESRWKSDGCAQEARSTTSWTRSKNGTFEPKKMREMPRKAVRTGYMPLCLIALYHHVPQTVHAQLRQFGTTKFCNHLPTLLIQLKIDRELYLMNNL